MNRPGGERAGAGVPPVVRLSSHGVARVALWPLETLEPHGSPRLAAAARQLARVLEEGRAEAAALAAAVGEAVADERDRSDRHHLLELRRALVRDLSPLPDHLRAVWAGPGLADHQRRRVAISDAAAAFAAELDRATVRAAAAARAQMLDPRFLVALSVVNPGLAERWLRLAAEPPARRRARHDRLERAVLAHLLRAAGRPTPHGCWAGVAPLEPDPAHGGFSCSSSPEEVRVAVDLRVLQPALSALGGPPSPRLGLPHRLTRPWAPENPFEALLVDAFGDGCAKPVAPFVNLVSAERPALAEPLRAAARRLVADGVLAPAPRADLLTQPDAWGAIAHVQTCLEGADARALDRWTAAMRAAADDLAAAVEALDHGAVRRALEDAHRATDRLWSWAGVVASPPAVCLSVDVRAPWSFGWGAAARRHVATLLGELAALHALDGDAERYRLAAVEELLDGRDERPVRELAAVLPAPARPSAATREALFARLGGSRRADRNGLAELLEQRWSDPEVEVDVGASSAAGAWGDQLLQVGPGWLMTAAWSRPQPGLFRHRFRTLIGPAPDVPAMIEQRALADGLEAASFVAGDCPNPGALVGTPLLARRVSAADAVDGTVVRGRGTFGAHLSLRDGRRVVPVHGSAALVGVGDPIDLVLYRTAMTWGWELPGHGIPELPDEAAARGRPRLRLPSGGVASPRRWIVDAAEIARLRQLDAAGRFLAWIQSVDRLGLPELVWVDRPDRVGEEPLPVRTDSPLHLAWLLAGPPERLRFTEGPPTAAALPVMGPLGHHLAELAVTWVGASGPGPSVSARASSSGARAAAQPSSG